MTVYQKQCLLAYLAQDINNDKLDPGGIDGIDGPKTQAAMVEFKRLYYCGEEGLVGAIAGTVSKMEKVPDSTTGTFWDDIKYFSREEFRCNCKGKYCNGFPAEPDEKMVRLMDNIRTHFNVPIIPHSGVRCKTWNKLQGGGTASQHLYGTACDFHVNGVSPKKVADYVETLMPNTGGIGLYSWGIHVDTRAVKARWDYR